jgi:hypothetical protein
MRTPKIGRGFMEEVRTIYDPDHIPCVDSNPQSRLLDRNVRTLDLTSSYLKVQNTFYAMQNIRHKM